MKLDNINLIYDISKAFVQNGQTSTARKTLEYGLQTRAQRSNSMKQIKKVPEFLLQVAKVLTELEKQKELNNASYAY